MSKIGLVQGQSAQVREVGSSTNVGGESIGFEETGRQEKKWKREMKEHHGGTRRDVLENLDPFVRGRLLHPSSSSFRRSSAEGFR